MLMQSVMIRRFLCGDPAKNVKTKISSDGRHRLQSAPGRLGCSWSFARFYLHLYSLVYQTAVVDENNCDRNFYFPVEFPKFSQT